MKKRILLTVLGLLCISVHLFAQSYVIKSVTGDEICYETHKDGKKNGFTQTIDGLIYPSLILDYFEKDSLLLSMVIDNGRFLSIYKDIEVNNCIYPRPDREVWEMDKYYNHKCNAIFFHNDS